METLWSVESAGKRRRQTFGAGCDGLNERGRGALARLFTERLRSAACMELSLSSSDDHRGLRVAFQSSMPGVVWQRCQEHLQRNAMAYVPTSDMREAVAADIRSIFNASRPGGGGPFAGQDD